MDMYPGRIRCYTTSMTEYDTYSIVVVNADTGFPLAFGVDLHIDVERGMDPVDHAMTIADWVMEGAAPFMFAESGTLLDNQVVQVTAALDEQSWQEALDAFMESGV